MVDTYGFDGIDSECTVAAVSEVDIMLINKVDWEHPSDISQCRNYIQMLETLRQKLPSPNYILTSALPAGEWALKNIDLAQAATYVDLINLMTYDFSGPWTNLCGHQAQLYTPRNPYDDATRVSADSAVNYLTSKGVPSRKILLGIPAYGRSFLGATSVGSNYNGCGGDEGTFEYKDLPPPGSSVHFDRDVAAVYCVSKDTGFVTYDDPRSVQAKATYAKDKSLGGLFYWTGTGDTNDSRSLVEAGYRTLCSSL